MADSSFASKKKSVTAFKGHFRRSAKAYAALLNVKPHPTQESLEKAYNRVQKQLDPLLSALDDAITLLDGIDSSDTGVDVDKEAKELNDCYDSLLAEQCEIERQYVEVKASAASISTSTPTSHTVSGSQTSPSTRPNVRVTALEPPSWSGKKADFYTWQKKFRISWMKQKLVMNSPSCATFKTRIVSLLSIKPLSPTARQCLRYGLAWRNESQRRLSSSKSFPSFIASSHYIQRKHRQNSETSLTKFHCFLGEWKMLV